MPFYNYQNNGLIGGASQLNYLNAGIKPLSDGSILDIPKDSLQLYVDAGNLNSYPGTGTTLFDLSGNGRNGTLVSGPTYSANDGGYIALDGTNDYINFGQNFNFTTEAFSIGGWLYINELTVVAATNARNPNLFWKGNINVSGYYTELEADQTGIFSFRANQSGASQETRGPSPGVGNLLRTWFHYIITATASVSNSKTITVYINTVSSNFSGGTATTPASAAANDFLIGSYNKLLNFANIRISQFYIWNRVLSELEITQLYNSARRRYGV